MESPVLVRYMTQPVVLMYRNATSVRGSLDPTVTVAVLTTQSDEDTMSPLINGCSPSFPYRPRTWKGKKTRYAEAVTKSWVWGLGGGGGGGETAMQSEFTPGGSGGLCDPYQ